MLAIYRLQPDGNASKSIYSLPEIIINPTDNKEKVRTSVHTEMKMYLNQLGS